VLYNVEEEEKSDLKCVTRAMLIAANKSITKIVGSAIIVRGMPIASIP
jgi:hypothetical protein